MNTIPNLGAYGYVPIHITPVVTAVTKSTTFNRSYQWIGLLGAVITVALLFYFWAKSKGKEQTTMLLNEQTTPENTNAYTDAYIVPNEQVTLGEQIIPKEDLINVYNSVSIEDAHLYQFIPQYGGYVHHTLVHKLQFATKYYPNQSQNNG